MKHPLPVLPDVSRETMGRIETYLALLERWNARINLIGPSPRAAWERRHIQDSLQLAALLPPGECADLGSGAGLPGLVLAATRPDPMHLVEADQRKAAFLREVAREMGLANVTVHATRIDTARLPRLSGITARALASLPQLLPWAHNFLTESGSAVFPKGRNAEAELTEAAPRWHMAVERFGSHTDAEATIFRIRNLRPV